MSILLSVAVVTRNRPESLERTLVSLRNQAVSPYEIVISDDSDSEFIEENKKVAQKYDCKYLTGPKNGLYANRNFVAKHCTGTHFRTMDDDHEFPAGHLEACLEAIQQDEKAIWTIGEYCPKYQPDTESWTLPSPVPGQLHPRGHSYSPQSLHQYYGISCGGTIYPRSVVDNGILNFDLYKFGSLYLEYGARLLKKGYTIKPILTTYIIHHLDVNKRSVSSDVILNSARVFSMLMLSFCHFASWKNRAATLTQIIVDLAKREYSLKLVWEVVKDFRKSKQSLLAFSTVVLASVRL